jgi:capsular polysaccharide biosynthesis protein
MELRRYWQAFRRRWPLVTIPVFIVLAVGLITYDIPPPAFNAGVQFIVGQTPIIGSESADEQRYYNWLTSEYIVNGLADWVRGGQFAEAVSRELAKQGHTVPAGAVQAGLAADNTRSMLTISLTYGGDADTLAAIMDAVIVIVTQQNALALPQLGGDTATLIQLGQPVVNQLPASLRNQLDLPLRILLALGAGSGLALLAEFLDPTIRSRDELENLGFSVMGEIPKK